MGFWSTVRATAGFGVALSLVLSAPAAALDPSRPLSHYSYENWNVRQGLPGGGVHAIAQTPDGYLWVATWSGLARFDGSTFTVFNRQNTPELSDNAIESLHVDSRGALWIGTYNAGLLRYLDGHWSAYHYKDGLPNEDIKALYSEPDGTLWIGAPNGGLVRFKDGRFRAYTSRDGLCGADRWSADGRVWLGSAVWAIERTRDRSLWVGTRGGVTRMLDDSVHCYPPDTGLHGDYVRQIHEDHRGRLLFATEQGLFQFAQEAFVEVPGLPDRHVRALLEDKDQSLWLGTESAGVCRMRDGVVSSFSMVDGLLHNRVYALFEDREGSLWVGTRGGLSRFRDTRFDVLTTRDGLAHDAVEAVLQDDSGRLWAGTQGGLTRIEDGHAARVTELPSDAVLALAKAQGGGVWVGSTRAVHRVDAAGVTSYPTGEPVLSLLQDHDGVLWVGGSSLRHLEGQRLVTQAGLPAGSVLTIHEDPGGRLWLGTQYGLARVDRGAVRLFTPREGQSETVHAIVDDGHDGFWLGTRSGLMHFHDGRFTHYGAAEGLIEIAVHSIVDDGRGSLWLTTPQGVFQVFQQSLADFETGKISRVSHTAYGVNDGMRSVACAGTAVHARDDRVYVPTGRGIVIIDPRHLERNPLPPPVHIQSVLRDDEPLAAFGRVPSGTRQIAFHYAGLSLMAPAEVTFKYKLEGFDSDWIDAGGTRAAYYTALPPGQYTFRVRAANNDGVWNEIGDAFAFVVVPRFHETYLFYALCLAALGLAAAGTHRLRVRHLQRERSRLESEVRLRNDELASANVELAKGARLKDEFLANMSHELRTPLNAVLIMSEALQDDVYGPLNAAQRDSLRQVQVVGQQLLTTINDILDLAKIEAGKLELELDPVAVAPLCEGCVESVRAAARQKNLEVSCSVDPAISLLEADAQRLKQAILKLLRNAVELTPEGGRIGLEVGRDRRAGRARFTVWDTGPGLSTLDAERLLRPFVSLGPGGLSEHQGGGLGLALVYQIVSLHGGSVSIDTTPGEGSRFHMFLPWEQELSPLPAPAEKDGQAALILLVEDQESHVATLKRQLLAHGYRVSVAYSGAEAIERARADKPALVIMDIRMPFMDGLEATRSMRRDPALKHLPIIALTAFVMPGDRERCYAAGVNDYQSKPISFRRLVTAIESQFARENGGKRIDA